MIYILNKNNRVTLGGNITDPRMHGEGYLPFTGEIPQVPKYHFLTLVGGSLVVEKDKDYSVKTEREVSLYIQMLLDKIARSKGYDNMMSARAVAGLPLLGTATATIVAMREEAIRLSNYYMELWGYAIEIKMVSEDVTIEEFISGMPKHESWVPEEPMPSKPQD